MCFCPNLWPLLFSTIGTHHCSLRMMLSIIITSYYSAIHGEPWKHLQVCSLLRKVCAIQFIIPRRFVLRAMITSVLSVTLRLDTPFLVSSYSGGVCSYFLVILVQFTQEQVLMRCNLPCLMLNGL